MAWKYGASEVALFVLIFTAAPAGAQEPSPAAADSPPASAQPPTPTSAPPAAEEAESQKKFGEEIVVTGSRLKRKDLTTPAPVTVVTRQEWQQSGKLTIGDFLQTLPEQGNAPNFQLNNGGATYSADGATRINLRSLGVTRTLVLVNGHRFVPGGLGASSAVDLNSIPAAAVDRIEVLKDGASAIYGSDAIAGVVNIITKRTFNETEATAQYGISGRGDAQTFDGSVTTGRSGAAGNFMFSAGYFNQRDSWLRDRPWSTNALTYDYSQRTATPGGSLRTPQSVVALPQNPDGTPLAECLTNALCNHLVSTDPTWTKDNFVRDPSAPQGWRVARDADRYNFARENYLTIPSNRIQAYSAGDTRLGPARAYYETSYVQRNSQQNAAPMPLNPGDFTLPGSNIPIAVSRDSMYNPFGVELPFAGRRLVEFGHRTYTEDLGTFRVLTGLDGSLPEQAGPLRGWYWDASLNYGRTSGTFTTAGAIRNSRIADAVGPSMLIDGAPRCVRKANDPTSVIPDCVPLNLFGGPSNGSIDPSQIAGLGFEGTSRAFDSLLTVDANTSGDLFNLRSDRPVSLALGYEFRRQSGAQVADPIAASGDSADFNFKSTRGQFTSHEAYAELSIPLISDAPAVKDLEASVAGRLVDYSTFGTNFTYKLGARYTPIPDVTLRGTYSTAFRAPSISELYLGQSETAPIARDPCNFDPATASPQLIAQCSATGVPQGGSGDQGNQEIAHVGGNARLKAETARIFTAGVVLQPRAVRNLSLTVDYYNILVDDLIGTLGAPAILAACYPAASGSSAPPRFCDLVTRAPLSSGGRILFVTDTNENVGQLRTGGLDFAARYALPSPVGRFGFAFDANWLARFDRTQVVGATSRTIHGKGNYDLGALPALKFNVGTNWSLSRWRAGIITRFVGSFRECAAPDLTSAGGLCNVDPGVPAPPSRDVGANVTVDLNAGYTLTTAVGSTSFIVGVNNVFDKAPQYVYSAALANSDPSIYDYVGRFVYTRLQHTF